MGTSNALRPPKQRTGRAHRPSGYLWILPAMVVSVGFIYFCVAYTGYISTLEWDGISPNPLQVGFDNYVRLANDPIVRRALINTAVFAVATFFGQAILGFAFAVLLHSSVRWKVIYKIVIFVPVILAPAIMAPVFRLMYSGDGQFNELLRAVGLGFLAQPWLAQTSTALAVVISIVIWHYAGFFFILYYAAVGQVDSEMIEAARLDGAGNWRVVTSIIWPSVRGTTFALAILSSIASLKLFDVPQLVTGGGPVNATEFLGTYIYRQSIPLFDVGYGAALSMLLLVLALIVALVLRWRGTSETRTTRRGVPDA